MEKLGFLYPKIPADSKIVQDDLGPLDAITPAGWNLIKAETVPAMHECFLRAMITPAEPCSAGRIFSPLRWCSALLMELGKRGEEACFSFAEFAFFVQSSTPDDDLKKTTGKILDFRKARKQAENKRIFDQQKYVEYSATIGVNANTINDYADMNIRYLKATGIVHAQGRGIALVEEKKALAEELGKELYSDATWLSRYQTICQGAKLPTDDAVFARQELDSLLTQLKKYNIGFSLNGKPLETSSDINRACYEIEELIAGKKEEEYARNQASQWKEIAAYMDLIALRRNRGCRNDTEISFLKSEAPAYLEWSVWRAFLAIDTLVNRPDEVRRFRIDQDFLPVGTAPGNGPDLIAEFQDFVIVIEVTLSENSRQEAMEGEPVRRHIADLMQRYHKPVYGLFLANRIDSNTAETFRIGSWYTTQEDRLDLQIIPLTLQQFSTFFKSIFATGRVHPQILVDLMLKCGSFRRECEAPLWKARIQKTVNEFSR